MRYDNRHTIPRYFYVIAVMTAFGAIIVGKAIYSMLTQGSYWEVVRERMATQQRTIRAVRGNIYSSDGQLLVGSMPVYTLRMDFVVRDPNNPTAEAKAQQARNDSLQANIDDLCQGLAQLFPTRSAADYKRYILEGQRRGRRNLLIARNVSYIKYREAQQLPFFNLGRTRSGFYAEEIPQRQKPYDTMATRTLGSLVTTSDSALNGLELAYDSILRGQNGLQHREKVLSDWVQHTDKEPVEGLDLITTIDVGMQDAAERILRRKLVEINAEVGVVVLMETHTGDIKAIVNLSRVAPGKYAEVKNNALTDLWEPGSTFKTASIMVALEDGVITRSDSVYVGNGVYMMHGRPMKDHNWRSGGYGRAISVDECLMFSSNVGVSRIIDEHYHDHPERYVDGLYREGVGVPFDLPFRGVGKPYVRRPKKDQSNWSRTALPWMSIGYETQIPPIYTCAFYNAIANDGRMVQPRFVREIRQDGTVLKEFPVVTVKERICSPRTLSDIRQILERVVNDPTGLGRKAGSRYFKVCGKTGTAQVADEHGSYHGSPARYMVSFAGFYPAESPRYSCVVCIKKSGLPASGGGQAGPVFSELAHYVMAKGIYRPVSAAADPADSIDVHVQPELPQPAEGAADLVPDTRGWPARDAATALEALGLKVRLNGTGHVVSQSITPGQKPKRDQVVTLTLK